MSSSLQPPGGPSPLNRRQSAAQARLSMCIRQVDQEHTGRQHQGPGSCLWRHGWLSLPHCSACLPAHELSPKQSAAAGEASSSGCLAPHILNAPLQKQQLCRSSRVTSSCSRCWGMPSVRAAWRHAPPAAAAAPPAAASQESPAPWAPSRRRRRGRAPGPAMGEKIWRRVMRCTGWMAAGVGKRVAGRDGWQARALGGEGGGSGAAGQPGAAHAPNLNGMHCGARHKRQCAAPGPCSVALPSSRTRLVAASAPSRAPRQGTGTEASSA